MSGSGLHVDEYFVAKQMEQKVKVNQTGDWIVVVNGPKCDRGATQKQEGYAAIFLAVQDAPKIESKSEDHMGPAHCDNQHFITSVIPEIACESERRYSE